MCHSFVTLDDELEYGGSLLVTVGVRSVRMTERSSDAVAACAIGLLDDEQSDR